MTGVPIRRKRFILEDVGLRRTEALPERIAASGDFGEEELMSIFGIVSDSYRHLSRLHPRAVWEPHGGSWNVPISRRARRGAGRPGELRARLCEAIRQHTEQPLTGEQVEDQLSRIIAEYT